MAGEWIPYDVCLPQKPEVLDLVDRTGLEVDQVVGRLMMLWGWAALNSRDGSARLSLRLLARVCGGDDSFWYAVQDVGWLTIDAEGGTVGIPGWDARFSKAAKSRALATVRHRVDKVGGATRPRSGRDAPPTGAQRARERGDRISSSSPGGAAQGDGDQDGPPAGWDTLRAAWKAGKGRPWQLPTPPDKAADRLAEDGWFQKALAAIDRLPACRYFRDPVTLPQFVAAGFVDKILGGQFDNPREQHPGTRHQAEDRRPAAQAAADWERAAADPEARKRREEFLAAKAKKAGRPQETGIEEARAAVLRQITGATT
jgi:hypothetical protein